jgi:ubiquinone/menaquinone biosynthesis C-methylase UbiE
MTRSTGFKDYAAEAEVLRALIQERSPDATSVLDVACGTGKHLEQFQRWYKVEGLDLDEGLLAVARQRLPDVPLHVADMTSFRLGGRSTSLHAFSVRSATSERASA